MSCHQGADANTENGFEIQYCHSHLNQTENRTKTLDSGNVETDIGKTDSRVLPAGRQNRLSHCASVYDNNIRMMLSLMLANDCIYLELPSLLTARQRANERDESQQDSRNKPLQVTATSS